jgi:hypothetical protein
MTLGTGCISIAAVEGTGIRIDRVIESFSMDRVHQICNIRVDIFLDNARDSPEHISVLHRGSLVAENVTKEAWVRASAQDATREISDYLLHLRESFEPIEILPDGFLRIEGREYSLWNGSSGRLSAIVGQEEDRDVPFSMWKIGPFPPRTRQIASIHLAMTKQSYATQIGCADEFYAYGDAILLDRVAEDVRAYGGTNRKDYQRALDTRGARIQPDVFEYVLVSLPGSNVRWKTTPISYNLSERFVPEEYRETVHWFVARYSEFNTFSIVARPEAVFVLRVSAADPVREGDGARPP